MNQIDFTIIYKKMQQLWPNWKETDAERGLYWSIFKEHPEPVIYNLIISVAGESDFSPPRKAIYAKLRQIPRPAKELTYNYIDTWFVCVETESKSKWIYPGAFRELSFINTMTPDEILRAMRRYQDTVLLNSYGISTYEYFIGVENRDKMIKRSDELKRDAKLAGILPSRFYKDYTRTGDFAVEIERTPIQDKDMPF